MKNRKAAIGLHNSCHSDSGANPAKVIDALREGSIATTQEAIRIVEQLSQPPPLDKAKLQEVLDGLRRRKRRCIMNSKKCVIYMLCMVGVVGIIAFKFFPSISFVDTLIFILILAIDLALLMI